MAKIEDAIARLRALVAQPNPAMRCEGCTGSEDEVRVFACAHEAGAPAGRAELDAIRKAVGLDAAADFVKFYSAFGELVLFRNAERADADDETALIHFVSVAGWDELKEDLEMWLESLEEEDWEEEADPDYPDEYPRSIFRDAVPFAKVPHSADLIFVASDGEYAGQVFQMDHETLAPMHRASSLAEFVEVIASDTDHAVEWFNSSIRYSAKEGREEQWFPVGVATGKAPG